MASKVKLSSIPIVAAIVVVGLVMRGGGDSGANFRMATVAAHDVTKTLDEVGTIEPVSAASVAFPVAGKVASVAVTTGATVTRGQALATLDPTTLQHAVDTAQAALAQAKLVLANAETTAPVSAQTDSSDALSKAQDAVLAAQNDVDKKLADAQAALASATDICAAIPSDGSDTSSAVAACQSALSDVLAAQQAAAQSQAVLSNASNAFDEAISKQSSRPTTPTQSAPSAADLVADQKAIDAASAAVAVANQNLAAATIVSPIDGTIEAVDITPGDVVTAASTTSTVRVVGGAGYEVTAIVGVDKLADVKLGQAATVTPDATSRHLRGQVVAIGAPRTANGSTTYPVSIGLDDDSSLRNGTVAQVAIVTGAAQAQLAVPTSAVHVETGRAFVYVANGSQTKAVDVVVGVIGKKWTQIKSGLTAGQGVVIADLNAALPGSATTSSNSNQKGNGGVVQFDGPPPGGVDIKGPQTFVSN